MKKFCIVSNEECQWLQEKTIKGTNEYGVKITFSEGKCFHKDNFGCNCEENKCPFLKRRR